MKITEALIAEHQVFHNLFDYIEQAAPKLKTVGEVKAVAAAMENMLKAHSKTEDELLIAPLEHCIEQIGQADTFHEEHEEIDRCLEQIQKAKSIAEARKLLQTAVYASRGHFNKEERILFPLANKVLSNVSLQNLGNAWERQRDQAE
jgi:regulator of cell morphogenesis and NO signaling